VSTAREGEEKRKKNNQKLRSAVLRNLQLSECWVVSVAEEDKGRSPRSGSHGSQEQGEPLTHPTHQADKQCRAGSSSPAFSLVSKSCTPGEVKS